LSHSVSYRAPSSIVDPDVIDIHKIMRASKTESRLGSERIDTVAR